MKSTRIILLLFICTTAAHAAVPKKIAKQAEGDWRDGRYGSVKFGLFVSGHIAAGAFFLRKTTFQLCAMFLVLDFFLGFIEGICVCFNIRHLVIAREECGNGWPNTYVRQHELLAEFWEPRLLHLITPPK